MKNCSDSETKDIPSMPHVGMIRQNKPPTAKSSSLNRTDEPRPNSEFMFSYSEHASRKIARLVDSSAGGGYDNRRGGEFMMWVDRNGIGVAQPALGPDFTARSQITEIAFMSRKITCTAGAWLYLATLAQPAWAHPGHGGHHLIDGLFHPLGWDHLLAMVAVGLLAVQLGRGAAIALPSVFVAAMVLGGMLSQVGMTLPLVEPAVAVSVLVLGLLIATSFRLSTSAAAVVVGAFALFHGYAHVVEGGWGSYAVGFVVATAMLHATGIALGLAIMRLSHGTALRWIGGAISVASIPLLAAVLTSM